MLPPQAPTDPNQKTNTSATGTHQALKPGVNPGGVQTPAQLAGLKPPVPGQKPPNKKH